MPDLLGWDADKGIEKLVSLNIPWTIEISKPPNDRVSGGYYKIIKQVEDGGTCRLTLSMIPDDYR